MKFSGEYCIPAPREAVWDALNDTAILKASITQLEELDWTGERDLHATVVTRIGPMAARFRASVVLSEIDAPRSYVLTGQGEGGVAGFARAVARVWLHDADAGATRFVYDCEAEMGGRLASVGGSLVKGVADKAALGFFERFADRLVVAMAARDAAEEPFTDDAYDPEPSFDALAERLKIIRDDEEKGGDTAPFAWHGAGAEFSDRLKELESLGLADPRAAAAIQAGRHPGMIPLNAATALIVGGWAAMAGILLLLFAT